MYKKYKNSKVVNDEGIKFDSKLESNIYKRLVELGLKHELQPKFLLQNRFVYKNHIIRPIEYIADFSVNIGDNIYILDAKGMETPVFKVKKKLFLFKYGTDIICIKSLKHFNEWYDGVINNAK